MIQVKKNITPFFPLSMAFLLILSLSGCDNNKVPDDSSSGRELYSYYCLDCHDQKHPKSFARYLAQRPDLIPYQLFLLVRYGESRHPEMPVFPDISDHQLTELSKFVIYMQQAAKSTQATTSN